MGGLFNMRGFFRECNYRLWFFSILIFCVSCQAQGDISIEDIVEDVWSYSLENPDGFTVEIPAIEVVTNGFSVGYYIGEEHIGKESLTDVVTHALENGKVVGGWLDSSSGVYYFDSVAIFDDSQQDEAHQFAIDNNQVAYYDLTNGVTIYVE